LPRSQAFKSDITEVLNFIRDSVEDLLTKRAIVYTVDNSADARDFSKLMFMDEDELERLKDSKEPEGKILIDLRMIKYLIFSLILIFLQFFSTFCLNIFIQVKYNKLIILNKLMIL